MSWNSNAFSRLRNKIGLDAEVDIRIDPLDLTRAYVFDAKRRTWIEGDLMTEDVEVGETLNQYEVIKKRGRETREPGESKRAAIARARGEIFEFVRGIVEGKKRSKAPKRFARFREDGRKPMEHVAPERSSPPESGGRRPGHRHDPDRPPRARHTAAGPYRRAVPSPEPDSDPPPVEQPVKPEPPVRLATASDPDACLREGAATENEEPEAGSDPPVAVRLGATTAPDASEVATSPPPKPSPEPPAKGPPTTLRRREI